MKVAIVGAGVSGLSAAYFLLEKDPDLEITVFEKSNAVGGRMSTRRVINKLPVDTGCQFLSIDQPQVHEFFMKVGPPGAIHELPQSILCLPEGFIVDKSHRYFLDGGMTQWAKSLIELIRARAKQGFTLKFGQHIAKLQDLQAQGFSRILVSAPGPEGLALGAKKSVEYHPCLSLIFSWHQAPREALAHYAYRDISSREGINWLGHEGIKRGAPDIWLAQVSPQSSREWFEAKFSFDRMEDLIQDDLAAWIPLFEQGEKTFIDQKYWTHAFPVQFGDHFEGHAFERVVDGDTRIYYLGDGYKGVGRAENAIESALEVAQDFFTETTSES